ncbi:unnamed protein product [Moneuplotes crassus]|uniref:Uncharacterized protein n=1 Tax=Euplotes crassus TaxID=5936 RepID=A0AAD1XW37_EUPCR|nr:unnamed protein product [Moneuplotes crassus]
MDSPPSSQLSDPSSSLIPPKKRRLLPLMNPDPEDPLSRYVRILTILFFCFQVVGAVGLVYQVVIMCIDSVVFEPMHHVAAQTFYFLTSIAAVVFLFLPNKVEIMKYMEGIFSIGFGSALGGMIGEMVFMIRFIEILDSGEQTRVIFYFLSHIAQFFSTLTILVIFFMRKWIYKRGEIRQLGYYSNKDDSNDSIAPPSYSQVDNEAIPASNSSSSNSDP